MGAGSPILLPHVLTDEIAAIAAATGASGLAASPVAALFRTAVEVVVQAPRWAGTGGPGGPQARRDGSRN